MNQARRTAVPLRHLQHPCPRLGDLRQERGLPLGRIVPPRAAGDDLHPLHRTSASTRVRHPSRHRHTSATAYLAASAERIKKGGHAAPTLTLPAVVVHMGALRQRRQVPPDLAKADRAVAPGAVVHADVDRSLGVPPACATIPSWLAGEPSLRAPSSAVWLAWADYPMLLPARAIPLDIQHGRSPLAGTSSRVGGARQMARRRHRSRRS